MESREDGVNMDRNRLFLEGSLVYSVCFECKLCIARKYSFVFEKTLKKTWKLVFWSKLNVCVATLMNMMEKNDPFFSLFFSLTPTHFSFFLLSVCPFSGFIPFLSLSLSFFLDSVRSVFQVELQLLTYLTQPYYMALAYIIITKLCFQKKEKKCIERREGAGEGSANEEKK